MPDPLPRDFYDRDPVCVARDLLGRRLVREADGELLIGTIVEVEAYVAQDDPASHAYRGQTRRNATMFGPPGHAYVYPIHSRHCLNAVTEPESVASAVLIRAIEPLTGIESMRRRRRTERTRDLARGPARLCEALAIDRALDAWDLTCGQLLWITDGPESPPPEQVVTTTRVGVTSGAQLPLRFFVAENRFVSKPGRRARP